MIGRNPDRLVYLGTRPSGGARGSTAPDWVQASEPRIERMLSRARQRPSGGWFVLGATADLGNRPMRREVDGLELVAWRDGSGPRVAPAACPHMGADLSAGCVKGGRLVCPWHGLSLGAEGHGPWKPFPVHDDGVLLWVQPRQGPENNAAPTLAPRPARFLSGVIAMDAACEPSDIIANRLDPWHGVHYHGHSFASLRVLDTTDDVVTLRVAYRVLGPLCVEVDATFHSPEPNTITMTIVGGEGIGSVVETHATPLGPGRTRVVEATLATSERPGFRHALRAAGLLRPFVERRAARLWREDIAYAERRHQMRERHRLQVLNAAHKTAATLSRSMS